MCPPDGSAEDLVATDYAYHWALDKDDLALASRYHDQRLALLAANTRLNATARAICNAEAAFFEARYRDNPRAARALLAGTPVVPAPARWRTEAAILLAEGRHAEGVAASQAGLAGLAAYGDLGIKALYEEDLSRLQALPSGPHRALGPGEWDGEGSSWGPGATTERPIDGFI